MSDTQNVLDQMTASIMGMKQEKATQLTPVGMESPPAPAIAEVSGDVFPHDAGIQGQISFSAKVIRENLFQMQAQLAGMEDCLQSIERGVGLREALPPVGLPPIPPLRPDLGAVLVGKLATKLATFEEKFAAQQADAQRQVFTAPDAPIEVTGPADPVSSIGGWACPAHGSSNIVGLMSRKGRPYRKCTLCSEFERSA